MNSEDTGRAAFSDPASRLWLLSTRKLRTALAREDLTSDDKNRIRAQLLRRLGPWRLASDGIVSSLHRDVLVRQRLRDLEDAIVAHVDTALVTATYVLFVFVGLALGTFVSEGFFLISGLTVGYVVMTQPVTRLLVAPLLLFGFIIRRTAIKRGRRLLFLGEPAFDWSRGTLKLTELSCQELQAVAHEKGLVDYESLSAEELILAIAELPDDDVNDDTLR